MISDLIRPFRITTFVLVAALTLVAACANSNNDPATIRLLTHKDFELPETALREFTESTGIEVLVFLEEDPTSMVDLLERSKENPVADLSLIHI